MTGALFKSGLRIEAKSTKALCEELEHFETDEWAARAILRKEALRGTIVDPCCGAGVLTQVALDMRGGSFFALDIYDWGFPLQVRTGDWLQFDFDPPEEFTVFMNPPFSKAVEFVEKAFELGAAKVICFQRFAWWESDKRRGFWEKNRPARIYACGDRAECWRHDIPPEERKNPGYQPHAWFVWEQGHPPGPLLGHVWKDDAA